MYYIFERLLKERGLRTVDVCKATGISQSTISNWKNRGNMLSPANLQKIADFFGVTLDYMVGKDDIDWDPRTQEIRRIDLFNGVGGLTKRTANYYENEHTREYMEFLHKNPEYSILFDASTKVKKEDIAKALKAIGIFIDED